MLNVVIPEKAGSPLKVLCLGAHADDIEIGCGGTVLKLLETFRDIMVYWVVLSANAIRKKEAEESAGVFLADVKEKNIAIKNFRDGFFPYGGAEIKEYFEELKGQVDPDLIFTHYRMDLHQDHRLISELTWNTFRNHLILEYEILKYDGDLGCPNFFVPLTHSICDRKIKYLFDVFKSQHENHWFTDETFRSTLRIRGIESNAPHGCAEAFYCRKLVF